MHPLQVHILKQLTLASLCRYSELKPAGVESNRFVYHLKALSDSGLIEKAVRGYLLTPRGKRYVDKLSLELFYPRSQPKIVTIIICRNTAGEYLLYRSKREPFFDRYCFPYGKTHFGENIYQAAQRELKEKTGLTGTLEHRGDVYLTARERGEITSQMLGHVFVATKVAGELKTEMKTGSCEWVTTDRMKKKEFAPGFLTIYRLVTKSKRHFFEEITE